MKSLDDIVEDAYQVFAGNKPSEELDACTACCMTEANASLLRSLPLRKIPLEPLYEYQDAAKPNKLNLSELKYFAPKYLEFIKNRQYPSYEPLLSLTRFGYFTKSDWSSEEWRVLNDFSKVFFREFINSRDSGTFATPIEILLMFYKGNFDVHGLLKEWEESSSNENLLRFNQLLEEIKFTKNGENKVRDAFSDDTFSEIICNWLFSESIKEKVKVQIENAIMNPDQSLSEDERETLSWKYEIVK